MHESGKWKVEVKSLSRVRPLATPWTAAFQAPQSMGFSRQEYWSGVPLPSPESVNSSVQINASVLGKSTYVHSFNKYWPSASCVLVTDCPRYHGPNSERASTVLPSQSFQGTFIYIQIKTFLFLALGVYPPTKRLKDVIWKDQLATNEEVKRIRHLINMVWARQMKHILKS